MELINNPQPAPLTVKWSNEKRALCEIYSKGMQLCFFNQKGEQCHQFVLCKDFLHDVIHATINKSAANIFGFAYSPKSHPKVDLDKIRLLATNEQDPKFLDKIPAVLDFIHQVEKHFGLKRTRANIVGNPPKKYETCGVVAFVGSGRWLIAPPMLSFYTLLIRAGFSHKIDQPFMETIEGLANGKIKPYQKNDGAYLKSARAAIDKLMKLGYRVHFWGEIEKNYPKEVSVSSLHNAAGIVGLASGSSRAVCKHWTRKQLQERLDGTFVPKTKEIVEVPEENLTYEI